MLLLRYHITSVKFHFMVLAYCLCFLLPKIKENLKKNFKATLSEQLAYIKLCMLKILALLVSIYLCSISTCKGEKKQIGSLLFVSDM